MAHSFANVGSVGNWLTDETLYLLKNKLGIARVILKKDIEAEYKRDFAIGEKVKVKFPWRPRVTTGLGYQPQNIERITTEVVVDRFFGVHFDYGTVDKLLNMERGEARARKEYAMPSATAIAQYIELQAAEFIYKNTANIFGVLGTNPTTLDSTSGAARQRFSELACRDDGERRIFVPPGVHRAIKAGTPNILTYMHPSDEIRKLYKDGLLGHTDGFDWEESNSLKIHTSGTWASTVTLSAAPANGATSLAITCTTGDTFKEGDVIGIGAIYRVNPGSYDRTESTNTMSVTVAQDVTGAASAATVPIKETLYFSGPYQNIDAQPASNATLTLFPGTTSPSGKVGKQGLVVHEDCAAFVSLPLPMPNKEEIVSQSTDEDTGLSVSFIRSWDSIERRWINRLDACGGFGRLYADSCSGRILCA